MQLPMNMPSSTNNQAQSSSESATAVNQQTSATTASSGSNHDQLRKRDKSDVRHREELKNLEQQQKVA